MNIVKISLVNINFKHSNDQIKIQDFCIVICNK